MMKIGGNRQMGCTTLWAVLLVIIGLACSWSVALADDDLGNPKTPKLLIDTSHNCFWSAFDIEQEYAQLINTVQGQGFIVTIGKHFENLLDYDVVIVLLSQDPYTADDITLARAFLDGGGVMLVMGEYASWFVGNENLNTLLEGLNAGVTIRAASVEDPVQNFEDNAFQIRITDFSSHCLNYGLLEVLYSGSAPLNVTNPDSTLYTTSADAYLVEDPDELGPFPMAALANPKTHPDWTLIVTGETSHLTDYGLAHFDNKTLVRFSCPDEEEEEEEQDDDDSQGFESLGEGEYSGGCSC